MSEHFINIMVADLNRYEEHRGTSKVNLKLIACAREVTLWTLFRAKTACA